MRRCVLDASLLRDDEFVRTEIRYQDEELRVNGFSYSGRLRDGTKYKIVTDANCEPHWDSENKTLYMYHEENYFNNNVIFMIPASDMDLFIDIVENVNKKFSEPLRIIGKEYFYIDTINMTILSQIDKNTKADKLNYESQNYFNNMKDAKYIMRLILDVFRNKY